MEKELLMELFDFHKNNSTVYMELEELLRRDTNPIVPFIGAGLSAPMIPTWYDFLHEILVKYEIDDEYNISLLRNYRYEEVAEIIHQVIHSNFNREIERSFSVGKDFDFSRNSSLLHIPDIFKGLVVTTNLDNALDKAYGTRIYNQYNISITDKIESLKNQGPTILRLHGDTINNVSVVFTKNQYDESYGKDKIDFDKQVPKTIKHLFVQCRMLFLGCSLEKDRILQVLESCESSVPRHFAVVQKPSDSVKYKAKLTWLSKLGIQPIWYPDGDYKNVPLLLQSLSGKNYDQIVISKKEVINLDIENLNDCTFFEVQGIKDVTDKMIANNWNNHDMLADASLAIPIGRDGKGKLVMFDIQERIHGPHGIIAGSTGSGKSECLQTILLSLAFKYPPDKFSFFVIDYKDGAMNSYFHKIPHMAGCLTNISPIYINRFLVSVKNELQRRKSVFNRVSTNHIDEYQKLYYEGKTKVPIPKLVIAVDEFAELKMEYPEFVNELVTVARIGRSLGIHLIFCTQKPSGVVDDILWSNTKFKICFNTQNEYDSVELLRIPNSTELTKPGQAILNTGYDSNYLAFSCAYSNALISQFVTQFSQTVNAIGSYSNQNGISPISIILPPLSAEISLQHVWDRADAIKEEQGKYKIAPAIGFVDTITQDNSDLLTVDLGRFGNIAVFDKSFAGRNLFLETLTLSLAHTYSPDQVEISFMDFEDGRLGYLSNLTHIKDIAYWNESDKVNSIIEKLTGILTERRARFAAHYAVTMEDYFNTIDSNTSTYICIINGYESFARSYDNTYDINFMLKSSANYGIYFVISLRNPSTLSYANNESFTLRFPLQLDNLQTYSEVMGKSIQYKPDEYLGRGLTWVGFDCTEFQTARAFSKDSFHFSQPKQLIEHINKSWSTRGTKTESHIKI